MYGRARKFGTALSRTRVVPGRNAGGYRETGLNRTEATILHAVPLSGLLSDAAPDDYTLPTIQVTATRNVPLMMLVLALSFFTVRKLRSK